MSAAGFNTLCEYSDTTAELQLQLTVWSVTAYSVSISSDDAELQGSVCAYHKYRVGHKNRDLYYSV